MEEFNDETRQMASPPARLAARLQRRNNSRKRSSAHSSRRSSVSSLHSASLSCHGGPYSTHVAQHLRRASIIEERKARLAERAAHAEQVRLRAAAAKAAPRSSNSEEKALAAHAAREKLLAEITARCEEEVKRAKRIAEETKEKKAAGQARLEAQLAEKSADAAKRRFTYQMNFRRPRTTSLAAVEEKKVDPAQLKRLGETAAAKIIQRAWRASYATRTATAFAKANINVKSLTAMDFEDVTKLISAETSMTVTMQFIKYLGLLDHETDETARRGAVRVFLSAFMVVAQPVQTFSHGGKEPQEQDLISKGKNLVNAIESAYNAIIDSNGKTTSHLEDLQSLFQSFTSGFHSWKSQDLGILADVIISSFVHLDLIVLATKDSSDGDVTSDYMQAIRTEQTKLLVRLKRLIGHTKAMERIKIAVRKVRKEQAARNAANVHGDNVPRVSTPVQMDLDMGSASDAMVTPPATPKTMVSRSERQPSVVQQQWSNMERLGLVQTVLPSNREIAHEIQIRGNYEVVQQPWTDAKRTLINTLRAEMRSSIDYGGREAESAWTHSMVVFIKSLLNTLVSERHPLHTKINTFLDPGLISQQVAKNIFVYNDFFLTTGNILKQLCSPGRDEIVARFCEDTSSDPIDRLFSLHNILDLMHLDHVNWQYLQASSIVRERGHEHECSMFEKDIDNGIYGLAKTKAWWRSGHVATTSVAPGTAAHVNTVYARALVELVFSNEGISGDILPETLQLDFIRLLKLRAKVVHMVTVASILLTSKIRLRRNRESLWTKEAEQLMKLEVLSTDVTAIVRQIESGHMMPDSTRSGLVDFVSRVLPSAVGAALQARDAEEDLQKAIAQRRIFDPASARDASGYNTAFREQIATYLLKSLREHLLARLSATSAAEKAHVTSGAAATLARIGMPEFVAEVGDVFGLLERVKIVDLKAHERWYDQIATQVNAEA